MPTTESEMKYLGKCPTCQKLQSGYHKTVLPVCDLKDELVYPDENGGSPFLEICDRFVKD